MTPLVAAYLGRAEAPDDAVREYVSRTRRAFDSLPFRVAFVERDPYGSAHEMRDSVRSSGTLAIWTGASSGLRWSALDNWRMRACHDTSHILDVGACAFGFDGERATFRHAATRHPGLAPLLASEIVCQASGALMTGAFLPQRVAWPDLHTIREYL